jgi:hypothetical protein
MNKHGAVQLQFIANDFKAFVKIAGMTYVRTSRSILRATEKSSVTKGR